MTVGRRILDLPLVRSVRTILLGVAALLAAPVVDAAVVSSTDMTLAWGRLRYYYDASVHNACDAVAIINVGTAMTIGAYDGLAHQITEGRSVVAIIADDVPFWIQKQNGGRYAKLANAIAANIRTIVPPCSSSNSNPKNGFFVGGHSGGGAAAVKAIQGNLLNFSNDVKGFIGLAPLGYPKSPELDVPTLLWGFSLMSCGVCPSLAAKNAYEISREESRVFYQVQTNNTVDFVLGGLHCSFTDRGCVRMCAGSKRTRSWIHESVGDTINRFIDAAGRGKFTKSQFEIGRADVVLHVNKDEVAAPNKREWWLIRPFVKLTCVFEQILMKIGIM